MNDGQKKWDAATMTQSQLEQAMAKAVRYPHKKFHKGRLVIDPDVYTTPGLETNLVISPFAFLDCTGSIRIGPCPTSAHGPGSIPTTAFIWDVSPWRELKINWGCPGRTSTLVPMSGFMTDPLCSIRPPYFRTVSFWVPVRYSLKIPALLRSGQEIRHAKSASEVKWIWKQLPKKFLKTDSDSTTSRVNPHRYPCCKIDQSLKNLYH